MPLEKREAENLISVIRSMTASSGQPLDARAHAGDGDGAKREAVGGNGKLADLGAEWLRHPDTLEWLFRQFYNRMIDSLRSDPIFVQLLANQPELVVEIQPKVVALDGSTLKGRVARLIAAGFFESGKRQGEARSELARTGSDPNSGQLSTVFSDFVRDGFLERTAGDRYVKAASLKVSERRLEA